MVAVLGIGKCGRDADWLFEHGGGLLRVIWVANSVFENEFQGREVRI